MKDLGFGRPAVPAPAPASCYITETDFATLYAAAQIAQMFSLWLDTMVTISWRKMGPEVEANAAAYFEKFKNCLRDWLREHDLPAVWIYAHEVGSTLGLHTHLNLFIPAFPSEDHFKDDSIPIDPRACNPFSDVPYLRGWFRKWAQGWPARQIGRPAPRAIRVTGPRKETQWLHWLLFSYLVKSYDPRLIVQSARTAPAGRPIYLGDLIAHHPRASGPVPMKQRVGVSQSLGPARRALGVPSCSDSIREIGPFSLLPGGVPCKIYKTMPAFRSSYEDGIRDVRRLYPPSFYKRITRLDHTWPPPTIPTWPPPPPARDEAEVRAILSNLNLG